MIKFSFSQKNANSHYVYIDLEIDNINNNSIKLQLASWRPGRYELGNFAKNIKKPEAFDEKGNALIIKKFSKDGWEILCNGTKKILFKYSYYAAELNAGACYADSSQLYINPIHCCFMIEGREEEEQIVELNIPENYRVAGSLLKRDNKLVAANYHELVDSPFIASATLKSFSYEVSGVKFFLHFNGNCNPDIKRITADFEKFTAYQEKFWGDFPFDEYHFLFQITPHRFYHGVEHLKNTVIALGPGYELNERLYEDLLGVSSHELFHAWNIKTIRPAEMLPYNYTKENYSESGFVYEGFTTYYGDKILYSSGVFNAHQYLQTLEERINKHLHNFGRFNYSLAQSSWDTWLDGYVPGVPYRKTSIYDEGCLLAFMLDVLIIKHSSHKYSLKTVCQKLYHEFGKKTKGYQTQDIIHLCSEAAGINMQDFFQETLFKPCDYHALLPDICHYIGIDYLCKEPMNPAEGKLGIKYSENELGIKITMVAPHSAAWKAGLFIGDEILAINNTPVRKNFTDLLNYFNHKQNIELHIISNEIVKTIYINSDMLGKSAYQTVKLEFKQDSDVEIQANRACWLNN